MRFISLLVFGLIVFLTSCAGEPTTEMVEKYPSAEPEPLAEPKPDSLLRHVVMFSFNEESTAADIQEVIEAFSALPEKIDVIYDYEWGTNNSPEGHDKGFTHAFFLTFLSEADRDVYLPHPDHKAFGAVLGPHMKDVLVVDYWAK